MKHIVGVSDMKVTSDSKDTLVTYSLGSCIGISIYDPRVKVGGILHYMLPDSRIDRAKAQNNPFMFADTGIPELFHAAIELGASKERMKIVVAGGAQIMDEHGFFEIGKKNYVAAKKLLASYKIKSDYEDVGGKINRTLILSIQTGRTIIKAAGIGNLYI
ncbi:MAG: chemotaxis protein CheD [Deltaproteobacteria bacterium]|nr:chemotaxis protein CheD [Deltaproteobacteria bacterium]MBW2152175.1 chemotaxis protein CheD [Deltaproteobacteria bacterium]